MKLVALILCGLAVPGSAQLDPPRELDTALVRFIESHRKSDALYGAPNNDVSDERWTWRAVRSLHLAGATPTTPRRSAASAEGPSSAPLLPSLNGWMGSDPLSNLESAVARHLETGIAFDRESVVEHVARWRSSSGGYGFPVPLSVCLDFAQGVRKQVEPPPQDGDHRATIGATAAAVAILRALGSEVPDVDGVDGVVHAIAELQVEDGTWRPYAGADPGLFATYDAVRALTLLDRPVPRRDRLLARLARHRHVSGGFAHAVDEPASLEATWLVLECLDRLGARVPPIGRSSMDGELPPANDPGDLELWQAAVEMGPQPATTVELARRCGIDLLLVKANADVERALSTRGIAEARGYSLDVACGREEYYRAWGCEGVGYATHCSDVLFPPEVELAEIGVYREFSGLVDAWRPARERGALVLSCSYLNRELLAPVYDLAARSPESYDGIMGTWAFTRDGDHIRENPWLHRYVGRVPMMGNHDAHGGDSFHWLHYGLRSRTLFFAERGDLQGLREAVGRRSVVAVAHAGERLVLYGHPHWVARARAERKSWDLGRSRVRGPGIPDPVVVPIDAASGEEFPFLAEGYGILVRAAARPWDDAFPAEVDCTVDGVRHALHMAPVTVDCIPALWTPLLHLQPGDHEIIVEAFGRTTRTRVRFGAPVRERVVPDYSAVVPGELRFPGNEAKDFVVVRPKPLWWDGPLYIWSNRADFLLSCSGAAAARLEVDHGGGDSETRATVFVNGREVGALVPGGRESRSFPVAASDLIDGVNWVSVRTNLAPWTPPEIPAADFHLTRIALVSK